MSYWYSDDYEYEPEPQIDFKPEHANITIGLSINSGQIELAIKEHLEVIFENRVKQMVREQIKKQMDTLLSTDYWSKDNVRALLYQVVKERFEIKYPEVAENKVNELYKAILEMNYKDDKNDQLSDLRAKARAKVDTYIQTELSKSVAQSKDYIEQFAKNYFANNLFRAMGMMDKMIPHTENIIDK